MQSKRPRGTVRAASRRNSATPKACPLCGSSRVATIRYGFAPFDPSGAEDVVFAGCVLLPGSPKYACRDCDYRWGRLRT